MYHGGDQPPKRAANPKESANIISRITFFFTNDFFRRGYRKDLEEDDIYDVIPSLKSDKLSERLERQWLIDKTNHKKSSSLRILLACFGRQYLLLGFVQLFMKIAFALLLPNVLAKLITYFTPTKSGVSRQQAIYYACALVAINVINVIYVHNYMLLITEMGIRIRTGFCSLIYKKALKLSPAAVSEITFGKIVTLITKDVFSIDPAIIFANDMWIGLILTGIMTYVLYARLGVAVFGGIGFFVLVIPLQVGLGKLTSSLRIQASKITDSRLHVTQETFSAIRIVKMYTWEKIFGMKIAKAREEEVRKIKKIYYAKAVSLVTGGLVSSISFYLVVMTYTWLGHVITAADIFFVTGCFHTLRSTITISIPLGIAQSAELFASLKRIDKVLNAEELRKPRRYTNAGGAQKPTILLENVAVRIKDKDILRDINIRIDSGFNLITGIVGGGKSSLMKTILEEYPVTEGLMTVHGKISFASEEPWLFPSTIKQNILFGQELNEKRYNEVIEVCALRQDIDSFDKGDLTIAGDRGLNLSKGQQARINIARAVYSDADIYLFDDCLSSLDTHVQDFVFRECFQRFLRHKIVVLVSHYPSHLEDADRVIIIDGGTVKSDAKPSEIPRDAIDEIISSEMADNNNDEFTIDKIAEKIEIGADGFEEDTPLLEEKPANIASADTGNIYHETKQVGGVSFQVYKKYFQYGGGTLLALLVLFLFVIAQAASSITDKLVSSWANVEEKLSQFNRSNSSHANSTEYLEVLQRHNTILNVYTIMIVVSTSLLLLRAFAHFHFSSKASVNLHNSMAVSIANATMGFFDQHYIGNILNRFSKDIGTIDEYLPFVIYEVLRLIFLLTGIVIVISTVNKLFLIPAALFLVKLYFVRMYYMPSGRSLKRLESATRSPVIGHLNASLEGLSTIRAHGVQTILHGEFDKHQDLFTSAAYMLQCASRAFGFVLDMLCSMFVAIIIAKFFISDSGTQAGNVGLAITQAIMLTGLLQWGIRQWAELENQMTSVERVLEYSDIAQERKSGQVLDDWPKAGEIAYEHVNLTYGTSKGRVLKDITFTVRPGEKIGVVGRTGAGKSSIISTLFRLYDSEGRITIDDADIRTLSLDFLRSNIAIIPQDPVLFLGTIRSNIDPTSKYSDEAIWRALETAKLPGALISSLDSVITEAGSNFSAGQRQLICLARAVASKNKIIVLDEATANMDPETDLLIHSTIKEHFADCTVLTIAHRLHSVMQSDRVMVVDRGEIVEFDTPEVLIANKDSLFHKMVRHTNL